MVLAVGSLFFGYCARDILVGPGSPFLNGFVHQANDIFKTDLAGEFLPYSIKVVPLFFITLSQILVSVVNEAGLVGRFYTSSVYRTLYRFFSHK